MRVCLDVGYLEEEVLAARFFFFSASSACRYDLRTTSPVTIDARGVAQQWAALVQHWRMTGAALVHFT